jgi:ABC-2 type transport system ATP-binding protein
VRVKSDQELFAGRLITLGCTTKPHEDHLVVQVPEGGTPQILWRAAADQGVQIRYLRPQRSTLEEIFLKAVERP